MSFGEKLQQGLELLEELLEETAGSLLALKAAVGQMRQIYGDITGEELPDSIDEALSVLEQKHHQEKERAALYRAALFAMHLKSEDPETQEILSRMREELSALDVDSLPMEECEKQLSKYVLIRKACLEENPTEKRHLFSKLNQEFDFALVYGLMSGLIQIPEETLLTRETGKEPEAAEAAQTEKGPETAAEAAQTGKEPEAAEAASDPWAENGILHPETVTVLLPDTLLKKEESQRARKFGVKEFKSDMLKSGSPYMKLCLVAAKDFDGMTREAAEILTEKDGEFIEGILRKLLQMGYFTKYTLDGYGQLYTLSSKGRKIFSAKEARSFLGLRKLTGEEPQNLKPVSDSANAAVTRLMQLRTPALMKRLFPEGGYGRQMTLVEAEFFFKIYEEICEGESMVFMGAFSSDPETFLQVRDELLDLEDVFCLVVCGLTRTQAKALAGWAADENLVYPEVLLYTDFASGILWQYENDREFDRDAMEELLYGEIVEEIPPQGEEAAIAEGREADSPAEDAGLWQKEDEDTARESAGKAGETAAEEETAADEVDLNQEKEESSAEGTVADSPTEDGGLQQRKEDSEPHSTGGNSVLYPVSRRKEGDKSSRDPLHRHHEEIIAQMLAGEAYCCAMAYVRVLAEKYQEWESLCIQLAYALNDPVQKCSYSSDRLFAIYFDENSDTVSEYMLAAVLRSHFLDECSHDYMLQQLQGAIAGNELLTVYPELNQVIYTLMEFKDHHHRGIDYYADYRQEKRKEFEQTVSRICRQAGDLYNVHIGGKIKENVSHKRVLETRKILFARDADLMQCLQAVRDDNRKYAALIEDFLTDSYLKEGTAVSTDHLDNARIDRAIDDAWEEAGKKIRSAKKTSDLMGSLRMNLFMQMRKVLEVLCAYAAAVRDNVIDEGDPGLTDYRRVRGKLIEEIRILIEHLTLKRNSAREGRAAFLAGKNVLRSTLEELQSRLEGSYRESAHRYFYVDFLRGDQVLLDEDYRPVFDEVSDIAAISLLARIERHFATPHGSLENRLKEIFHGGDDYGSAALILTVLREAPETVEDKELLRSSIEDALVYPRRDLENRRKAFIEDLELAQSYGQIDNTLEDQKETMIQLMDLWYEWALESGNFGFFYKILEAMREKIREGAQTRATDLKRSVDTYRREHPQWENDQQMARAVRQIDLWIQKQNYAAAEDLLNRLIAGDIDSEGETVRQDYLEEFFREYPLHAGRAGSAGAALQGRFGRGLNKDTRGANRLVECWPKGSGAVPARIRDLLIGMGFPVEEVTQESPIAGKDHYHVRLKRPENGRRSNYRHPIAAFGSEAEDKGFRVVCIFGKMNADRLIDTAREIGSSQNTLILLDYALTLPDRRELARRTKTELGGKIFAVIDRIVLLYLASHYTETAVNRMLMAVTMPFAYYQPYVSDSAKTIPPEMFIGRKHELELIESAKGVNIVYGGRQLGKSALLGKARKDIDHNENGDRAVLVDIKGLDYAAAAKKISAALYDEGVLLHEKVTEDWDELSREVRNRLRENSPGKKIPYLLLLLDEADAFIESCEAVDYHPFDALKEIQSIGSDRFKFVVAGLRNIVRFKKNIALSNNRVLTHLGSLTVTPFKVTEARELLEQPLFYLGLRFPEDNNTEMLISTIFGTTNYFPGLLQLYCSKLIEAMRRDYAGYAEAETPPYIVREDHIKKVLSDKTLEQQIREKFFITLKVGDDDYYYLIALLAAYHYHNEKSQNGCSPGDIRQIAETYGIEKLCQLTEEEIDALMEEMQELNVLQRSGSGRYRFARHSFCQMMGSAAQIDDEILSCSE